MHRFATSESASRWELACNFPVSHDSSTLSPVIHIGFPKAASTFIKRAVFSRVTRDLVIPRGKLFALLRSEHLNVGHCRELFSGQLQHPSDPLVISNEALSGSFWSDDGMDLIAQNLQRVFPDAKVIIVLREQLDYITSAYNYSITQGRYLPPYEAFLARHEEQLMRKLQYDRIVSRYLELFGDQNVAVLPFELIKVDREAFTRELTTFIGAEPRYAGTPAIENRSLKGAKLVNAVRRANRIMSPIVALETRAKQLLRGEHHQLRSQWESYSAQQLVVSTLCRVVQDRGDVQVPCSFAKRARRVFAESNRRCGELITRDLARYGYAAPEASESLS